MKKIIAILLILTLGLTLIACGGKESADMSSGASSIDQSKCKHDWEEADCTNPETCKICGLESGKPLGHEYYEGVCLKCGAELPEEIVSCFDGATVKVDLVDFDGNPRDEKWDIGIYNAQ